MSTGAHMPRRTIAVYESYAEAQRAVDILADRDFPVERVAIVGRDLRYVEQITGRLSTGTATLLGAAQGAAIGSLFGLFFGLIFATDPNPALALLVLYSLAGGAIAGAIFGALAHIASGRKVAATAGTTADRFELVVDEEVADRAARILHDGPAPERPADPVASRS